MGAPIKLNPTPWYGTFRLAKGAEVGAEIGYYVGACAVLRREAPSERARRAIEAVEIMIRDASQQSMHDLDLEALRVKFRTATSHFRLKPNALAFLSPADDRLGF